mgnify:CR=1 FL=1
MTVTAIVPVDKRKCKVFLEGDFVEGYGYEPDLWCPAVWAEEATVRFLNKQL